MTRIYFVRHGETLWNKNGRFQGHSDIALSFEGRLQAEKARDRLATEEFDAVYSSDLSRAKETAEILCQDRKINIEIEQRLRECCFGQWEGKTYQEILDASPDMIQTWHRDPGSFTIPDGEAMDDVKDRVKAAVLDICKNHPDSQVLVVSHGGIIRMVLSWALGLSYNRFWQIRQDNTAINVLDFYDDKAIIALINDCNHLGTVKR